MDLRSLVGRLVGDYQIKKHLGGGGMGSVFLGWHRHMNLAFAIKVLLPEHANNEQFLKRFFYEANLGARLRHENTVSVHNAGIAELDGERAPLKLPYLAMEYVEGQSVRQAVKHAGGRMSAEVAVEIAVQALRGLAAAHELGLIHRDIKPDNLMVARDGRVKIADFGLARDLGETGLTQTGQILGTPNYMSLEQWKAEDELDARSDLYSLGVTLYTMLSGEMPFPAKNPTGILHRMLAHKPVRLREHLPALDAKLELLVHKLLAKDRERRPASAREALTAFEAWQQSNVSDGAAIDQTLVQFAAQDSLELALYTTGEPSTQSVVEVPSGDRRPPSTSSGQQRANPVAVGKGVVDAARDAKTDVKSHVETDATNPLPAEPANPEPVSQSKLKPHPPRKPIAPTRPRTAPRINRAVPPTSNAEKGSGTTRRRAWPLAVAGLFGISIVIGIVLALGGTPEEDASTPSHGAGNEVDNGNGNGNGEERQRERHARASAAYEALEQTSSLAEQVAAHETFLEEYPDAPQIEAVRKRHSQLRARLEQERERDAAYEALPTEGSLEERIEAHEAFLQRYPDAPQADDLQERLSRLRAQLEQEKERDAAYTALVTEGPLEQQIEARETFLERYPDAPQAGVVREQLAELRNERQHQQERAQALAALPTQGPLEERIAAREAFLERFPDAPEVSALRRELEQLRVALERQRQRDAAYAALPTEGPLKERIESREAFLEQFPDAPQTEKVRERLSQLRAALAQEQERERDAAYEALPSDGPLQERIAAHKAFLEQFPDASQADAVQRELERLRGLLESRPDVEGFSWLRTETFRAGGQRHTVQVYRHEAFASALGLADGETDVAAEFVLIPAGRFTQGSTRREQDWAVRRGASRELVQSENPQRTVNVSRFLLARTPVTQEVWDGLARTTGTSLSDRRNFRGTRLPIERVSWKDVQPFLEASGLRLPSESEWEYACRAGTTTRYFFGDSVDELGDYAWYRGNSGGRTREVGGKRPNAFGLYDMQGNVWEWVQDTFQDSYDQAPTDGRAWEVADASKRVSRGGGWLYFAGGCRSAYRSGESPDYRAYNLGFRPARSVP